MNLFLRSKPYFFREIREKQGLPVARLDSAEGISYCIGGLGASVPVFQELFGTMISIAVPNGETGDEKAYFIGRLKGSWETQPIVERLQLLPSFSRYLGIEYIESRPLSRVLHDISCRVASGSLRLRVTDMVSPWVISFGEEDVLLSLKQHLSTEVVNFTHLLMLWKSGLARAQIEAHVPEFFKAYPELQAQITTNLARLDDELAVARREFAQAFNNIADRRQSERDLQAWLGHSRS